MMEQYLAVHTPEAQAYSRISENLHWEEEEHSNTNEAAMALSASYLAFRRYLDGEDLFLVPTNVRELTRTLIRYSHDAIHNIVSQSRTPLQRGGYGRVCDLAEDSVRAVLKSGSNARDLLALHHKPAANVSESRRVREVPTVASSPTNPEWCRNDEGVSYASDATNEKAAYI